MKDSARNDDLRLARFLAPGHLLREVDELVLKGHGGYETRQEFFLDAVQNQLLEVKYGAAEDGQRRLARADVIDKPTTPAVDENEPDADIDHAPSAPSALANGEPVQPFSDFAPTTLVAPSRGAVLNDGLAVIKDEPLFGLHNRDYPSIWAAYRLADETQKGPVPLQEFLERATREAWRFAAALSELEKETKVKLTALFPKNWAKPQSAEESFKSFAIGALAKKPREDGKLNASGPIFTWGLAQVILEEGRPMIGLTEVGYELLDDLDGISLRQPHEPQYATRFLTVLRQHASADAAGFEKLLEVVSEGPTRIELAGRFKQWRPEWSETESNTNAAGFVARAREWGLLEPKLIDGRYALAEFGERQRTGVTA